MRSRQSAVGGFAANRGSLFSIMRLLCHSVFTTAAPMAKEHLMSHGGSEGPVKDTGDMFGYYVASAILVLAGGAFAGLTIALMGQDGIYLQVLAGDSSEPQSKNAQRVYDLLKRGKHWVLVTLLLSNVIVNETLPVVLDRCLGGGVAAVIGSTVLIVIFGEVIPQSVCVRFGLQIGGAMSKPVLAMMWLMAPVAWPIAKLLDWMLGEDHPTVYKKSGLKQLVNLHQTLGDVSNRLNADEVTIISAVLDLKDKPVKDVMTPMDDVFVMPDDAILDERMMDRILSAGYSRIPIHSSGNPTNFVGMLLVKILITYDPEDCKRVSDFSLATLPETLPDTNCLDIVNFFQEGKSHMVLVSNSPGEDHGALGVVTLEDVIEELIGEEIIDESDVFIDVHKAIRRLTPAPKARVNRHESDTRARQGDGYGSGCITGEFSSSPEPMTATFMMRASSTDGGPSQGPVAVRSSLYDMKSTLKRLGPSNPAANPKESKFTSVKIKHGLASPSIRPTVTEHLKNDYFGDEHTPLLAASNTTEPHHRPLTGKGGVQALRKSYGSQSHDTQTHLSVPIAVGQAPQVTSDEQHPVIPSAAFMSLSPVAEIPASVLTVDVEPVTVAPLTQPRAPAELPATQDLPSEELIVDGSTQTPRHPFIESSSTVVTTITTETYDSPASVPTPVAGDSSEGPEIAERNASEPHADSPFQSSAQSPPIDTPKGSSTPATDVTVYRTTTGSVFTESIIESQGVRKIVIHTTSSSDEAGPSISQVDDIQDIAEDGHNGQEEANSSAKPATVAATSGKKKKNKKNKKARK